jgi:transposase
LLDAWAIENHGRKTYIWSAESTAFRREPTMHSHSIGQWTHDHVFLGSRHHQHERRAWFVVGLTTVMMVGEISVGWLSGSMALLADGSHMATHAAALGIAALAYLFARRQSGNARFTFGTGKFGDLAAFSSAIILAMIAIQIAYESVVRLAHPVPIAYGEAIAVAVLGLGVNLVSAWLLRDDHSHHHGDHHTHGHQNDAADAEAICEAVTRANMRFVPTKALEQQSCLMLHRTRDLFIRQQTAVINAIRAHLAEFGIVAPVGRRGVEELLDVVADTGNQRLPELAHGCLAALGAQLRMLKAQVLEFDRRIMAWHRSNETSRRLDEVPGIGPALATALVASIADPKAFRSGRDFSAWIGLVPKQNASGGKDRLGSISKQGDRYLRSLFTAGALAVIRYRLSSHSSTS